MNQYFGYIRVSTTKQGESGVSLQQQREAIERYAQRSGHELVRWFEEQETAAKQGRPVFNEMMKLLRRGKARGVIIHKIDRSARNLRDWADLGDLIDQGIDVCFANESLDLQSRGGRLSADIQAVVASDYIRNLREEAKKGFYGRLKQGIYPMPAPLGYMDMGGGQPKAPDPQAAPLVKKAFELYSSGRYGSESLARELESIGLRSRNGKVISHKHVTRLLNNPFYMGLIRVKRTNETFVGAHLALVPKSLFERVQDILHGRLNARPVRHDFLFRKRLRCADCEYSLVGETHKGFVYYRCQTTRCPTTAIRQEIADQAVLSRFADLRLQDDERRYVASELRKLQSEDAKNAEDAATGLKLRLAQIDERMNRLTDAYIDRLLEKDAFEERKKALLVERIGVTEKLTEVSTGRVKISEELEQFLERAGGAYSAYKIGNLEERRELVDSLTSNRLLRGKTLEISLAFPLEEVANRDKESRGGPRRAGPRTWSRLLPRLIYLINNQRSNLERRSTFPSPA
jgi:site-specific DNA recombinase